MIIVLDPAAPLFSHEGPDDRVDPTDADFVEVYHTSTTVLGIAFPAGDVDFYINGGKTQPGCTGVFGNCL